MTTKEALSFKLSTTKETFSRSRNFVDDINEDRPQTYLISEIARGELVGGKKEKKEQIYVIPLEDGWSIKNRSLPPLPSEPNSALDEGNGAKPSDNAMDVDIDTETIVSNINELPPLLRNRPPGLDKIENEKDKFQYDVLCRPDEASWDDYDKMPLERFGEAMLRGMGWKPGDPIGLNSKVAVPVTLFIKRPERLGLGAKPKAPEKKPDNWIPKPGESREPKQHMELPKTKDGRVRHWKTIDEKLKPMKYDKSSSSSSSSSSESEEKPKKKRKREDNEDQRETKRKKPVPPRIPIWACRDIKVKICDKKKKKFYCKSGWIIDILPGSVCTVKVVEFNELVDIDESELETVVPQEGGKALVVRGEWKGQTGVVRQRNKDKGKVTLLMDDELEMVEFDFDDVAQYQS